MTFLKGRYFLLTHFFLTSISSHAQGKFDKSDLGSQELDSKFEVLIGTSVQYPAFYYQPSNQEKHIKLGYAIGFGIVWPIRKRLEVNARLLLDKKRFENRLLNPNDHNYPVTGFLKNDYLTITFAFQYMLGKQRQFSVGIGGYLGSLQKSEKTTIISDPNSALSVYSTYGTYGLYKKYDGGLIVTLGYTIILRRKYSLAVQLLGSNGLRDINNYAIPYVLPILRNNSLSLIAFIKF